MYSALITAVQISRILSFIRSISKPPQLSSNISSITLTLCFVSMVFPKIPLMRISSH
uniref:Uncharacterized protein n=1 Tax=uncultured marine virus TaxID=186617 RepID=A0A0F7L3H5_9VIRU|nr:hypothetical protein [uncultured marine virus]